MKSLFAIFASLAFASSVIANDNVVVVLDGSGSMSDTIYGTSDTRMDVAKKALTQVLSNLPADTNLGILVFEAMGVQDEWIYPPQPRDSFLAPVRKDVVLQVLTTPQPGGSTPLGTYIKKGADALLEFRTKQHNVGNYRLILVTDGESSDGNLMDQYVPLVRARGIQINVIGLDLAKNHTLATMVDSYQNAKDSRSLATAVSKVLGEVPSNKDSSLAQQAFDELDGFPAETAKAAISALTLFQNQPIGESPVLTVATNETGQTVVSQVPNAAPAPADSSPDIGLMGLIVLMCIIVAGVIVVFVAIVAANS